MRRTVTIVVMLVAGVASLAAAPVGPEVEDPCGDTESYIDDTPLEHPVPAGTDLAAVDVVDRSGGGFDVVFDVCGERLPVATNDALSFAWDLPTSEGCTATTGSVRVVNDVAQAGLTGTA